MEFADMMKDNFFLKQAVKEGIIKHTWDAKEVLK